MNRGNSPPDVVTFGEAMVRLAPGGFRRIEQAYTLDVEIGGAELNTSVGLARFGRRVSWVSRLTDNPLGRLIANRARETGVAVDDVLMTPNDRVGLYFLEFGSAPRPSGIIYDRTDSAMAKIAPGMVDWPAIFAGAKWFYVTGITAALSASSAAAVLEALEAARRSGLKVCLDPNYRAKLWSVEKAAEWLKQAVRFVDVLITNPEDIARFFDVRDEAPEQAAESARVQYGLDAVLMTLRTTPSVWRNTFTAFARTAGRTYTAKTYEVEIVDRLGAGDAFVSGVLHGLLDGDLGAAVEWGTAAAALKHTVPGDFPWLTRDEVAGLLEGGALRIRR